MNATRQSPRTNLRSFFSTVSSSKPVVVEDPVALKKQGSSKKIKKEPAPPKAKPYKKRKIPAALREAVWIKTMGRKFEGKCPVVWCPNIITAFNFQAGHNVPESKGGKTILPNLIAICDRCNFSMGNQYTITEWNAIHAPGTSLIEAKTESQPEAPKSTPRRRTFFQKLCCCFFQKVD